VTRFSGRGKNLRLKLDRTNLSYNDKKRVGGGGLVCTVLCTSGCTKYGTGGSRGHREEESPKGENGCESKSRGSFVRGKE